MKPVNPKRLVASAIIFLFTSFSTPMLADAPVSVTAPAAIAQESVTIAQAPSIHLGAPRVVDLQHAGLTDQAFQTGGKAVIRSVDYSYTLANDLTNLAFFFGHDIIQVSYGQYSDASGGYVNLAPTDLQTGCINIRKANTMLECNIQSLLANPEKYHVRPDILNVQLGPKIITDSATRSSMLAMEPWDFRLVKEPKYNDVCIKQMFTNAYSAFKSYGQIVHNQDPQAQVLLHTSFWGADYNNNVRMTTAIQLLAAHVAGVDKMIFHLDNSSISSQVIADSCSFVLQQDGKNIGQILADLNFKGQQGEWMAGAIAI